MGAELFVPRRDADGGDESIGAFMTRRFGREATTYLAEPLLAGIHAGDVDRLSLARAVSAIRRRRAEARQPDARVPAPARGARRRRARSSRCPGGLSEMVRGARRRAAGRRRADERRASARDRHGRARTRPSASTTAAGARVRSRALVLATPAYVTAALVARSRRRARASVRRDSVRVDRHRRARVPRTGDRPPVERIGLRRAARRGQRHSRRVVAVVEMAASGAERPGAAAHLRRRRARSRRRSSNRMPNWSRGRSPRSGRCSDVHGDPLFTRVYRFDRASAQHEVGHLERMAAHRSAARRASGAVPHRQRVPRRRHSRLHRRRARDRRSRSPIGWRTQRRKAGTVADPQRSQ